MSNLENNKLFDRLGEEFDSALWIDSVLNDKLAEIYLEPPEYMLHCQDGDNSYLDAYLDDIYEKVKEAFINCEGSTFDIRALVEKAYDIEI